MHSPTGCQPLGMTAPRRLALLGVPTSAGSHHAGQEKAPATLRAAGLVDTLRAAGADVQDRGDLAVRRHRPSPPIDGVRDLDRVVGVVGEVDGAVSDIRASSRLPVVQLVEVLAPAPATRGPYRPPATRSTAPVQ